MNVFLFGWQAATFLVPSSVPVFKFTYMSKPRPTLSPSGHFSLYIIVKRPDTPFFVVVNSTKLGQFLLLLLFFACSFCFCFVLIFVVAVFYEESVHLSVSHRDNWNEE